jgi:hypothetical protein
MCSIVEKINRSRYRTGFGAIAPGLPCLSAVCDSAQDEFSLIPAVVQYCFINVDNKRQRFCHAPVRASSLLTLQNLVEPQPG